MNKSLSHFHTLKLYFCRDNLSNLMLENLGFHNRMLKMNKKCKIERIKKINY